jgi:integrase
MAILAECPVCHRKQKVKNKVCTCGADLDKEKRRRKVKYWVVYRLANGRQRKEFVRLPDGKPGGIEEAKGADGKRRAQKKENPTILERVPAEKITFAELTSWYLGENSINDLPPYKGAQKLTSYERIKGALANFNREFGDRIVSSLKPLDLQGYQDKREEEGRAPATIDMEISLAKTMITRADDNNLVDGRTVKAFRVVKRKLKKASNVRKRTLTIEEYLQLLDVAPDHLKAFLVIGFNTGMRLGELRGLRWSHIDREKGFIRLPAELTKESKAKVIPINCHVKEVLEGIRRGVPHIEFVLTYQHEPIVSPGGLKNSFMSACRKAGIPQGHNDPQGITFHDIRRTVKTNMLASGVDKVYRDLILGHSLQGMDVHYLAPSEERLQEAMAKYTVWLEKQIKESVSRLGNLGNI